MVGVSGLDVSENPLSVHHWKMLFEVFASTGVRIERMRFFGCPTMDDEVVGILADYLEHLGFESLPLELHLSHCNITTKGFCRLVDSIKANPAFPYIHPRTEQPLPLYLRLEKNYIDQAAIISYMETRTLQALKKFGKRWSVKPPQPDTKIRLLMRGDGTCYQYRPTAHCHPGAWIA